MNSKHVYQQGFSAVEALITLFVSGIFIIIFSQLQVLIAQSNALVTQTAEASSLAYSKLREITTKPSGFVCDNNSNLMVNAAAPGWQIANTTVSGTNLPGTVTTKVFAFAPRGCGSGQPILIKSTIEYGINPIRKVTHATYVPGS